MESKGYTYDMEDEMTEDFAMEEGAVQVVNYNKMSKTELVDLVKELNLDIDRITKTYEGQKQYSMQMEKHMNYTQDQFSKDKSRIVSFYENRHNNLVKSIEGIIALTNYEEGE